ncbi:unnamed protein product [Amoebophrya sp. A25]|nr:unnamed protein product [Amoebophrya sp. A25]|eukprot:GSA25T00016779001.1
MASTDTFANLDDRETQKDLATVFFVIAFLAGSVATAILLHQSWNLIKLYRFLARYQAAANAEYAGVLPWWLSEQKTDDPGYIYAIDAYDNPDAAAQVRPQDYGYYNQREAELQQWEENHVWGVDRQADLDIITQKAMRDGLKRPDDELHLRINAQEDRFKAQGDAAYVEATLADSENYPSNFLQAAAPGAQPKGQGKKGKGGKKAGKKMGRMK